MPLRLHPSNAPCSSPACHGAVPLFCMNCWRQIRTTGRPGSGRSCFPLPGRREGETGGSRASGRRRPACGGSAGSRRRRMRSIRCAPARRMNAWRFTATRSCRRSSFRPAACPATRRFCARRTLAPLTTWQKRFLQHLEVRCPSRRWVLKSPDHGYGLEALFSVFPDAQIVQTHRNPLEVVKSLSQLTEVLRGLYARPGDREQLARREARAIAERMERFIRFREVHPELAGRFIDVNYSELVADPLAAVRRIYHQLRDSTDGDSRRADAPPGFAPVAVSQASRRSHTGRFGTRCSGGSAPIRALLLPVRSSLQAGRTGLVSLQGYVVTWLAGLSTALVPYVTM